MYVGSDIDDEMIKISMIQIDKQRYPGAAIDFLKIISTWKPKCVNIREKWLDKLNTDASWEIRSYKHCRLEEMRYRAPELLLKGRGGDTSNQVLDVTASALSASWSRAWSLESGICELSGKIFDKENIKHPPPPLPQSWVDISRVRCCISSNWQNI